MAPGVAASGPSFDKERIALYESKMTPAVALIAVVAASGGLLFGFDNGISGGVIAHPDFGPKFFPHMAHAENKGDAFCKYDDHLLQLFTSSLFLAAGASAMVGSWTCNKFGRKLTMLAGGLCFLVGTALVAGAVATPMLVVGRIVLGFGVGFACQATPLYLSEMAPHTARGSLNIMFQLAVTIGILAAQLINYGTQYLRPHGWRVSLAMGAVPALLLTVGALILPDTPNALVLRGKKEEGRKVLQRIRGTEHVDVEFEDIVEAVNVASSVGNPYRTIVRRRYWPQLTITILIPVFQQLTGINAIMFYAPQLFEATGASTNAALLASVVTGVVNVVSTLVAIFLVDRAGRRFLFLEGGTQMIICEVVVGVLIHYNFKNPGNEAMAGAIVALICIYVAGFAWSWGPLGWLVPSEIQPLETRAAGMGIATLMNFLFTFLIGQIFLSVLCGLKYGTFFLFAGFVVIMTLFVLFCVPETKGVPIEELNEVVTQKHWLWSRVVKDAAAPQIEITKPKKGTV
ncbi:sugar transport protein [Raphidocelis subcapitata]|uniref:Sugar transport protein n=1 Tax=Raphidocelis subcapitata TaxID=307507 RepID=A0A2V0NVV5_9CHLO|nr:sugar transport protein [Raphidocelis subcapitata]|eukprot:GBF88955.1 sugar transport protein [Raphidocelis subcapitata]